MRGWREIPLSKAARIRPRCDHGLVDESFRIKESLAHEGRDTTAVSKVGQGTLPQRWRDASGLSGGGVVGVRPPRDGLNSIVLTPKPDKRRGAVGLLARFARYPKPIEPPERHPLPLK